jgi:hypothetical protein
MIEVQLVGGPADGLVVAAALAVPVVMLEPPRAATLLDEALPRAVWNDDVQWYEPE